MIYLDCVEVEPGAKANAAIIWLHGLGASGHDFESIVPAIQLPDGAQVRFVFPHAPEIPVTVNGGHVMPAWYDILEMTIERNVDKVQLLESAVAISKLISREIERGIASERIIIAGFSQGGAVAYQCALSCDKPLAGVLALSTYFATADSITTSSENQNIPIKICHGINDEIVPESLGVAACETLKNIGRTYEYSTYPMAHEVTLDEIRDISIWFQKLLAE